MSIYKDSSSINRSLVVGLTIAGRNEYWSLALATLMSLKKHLDIGISKILIATEQVVDFENFKQLEKEFDCEIIRIIPRGFYKELVPQLKGNYATYWKFDLFWALSANEILMYIDVDAFAVNRFNISKIINLFESNKFHLAAVPSLRPVLERVSAIQLNNPFDYFNAGVLFGIKDKRYSEESIKNAYYEIMKFDSLNLMWHDQDIFNYLFRSDYFKLPYIYNLSSGYLHKNFRAPFLLNGVTSYDIKENTVILHMSGDYLFSQRFHPAQMHLFGLLESCKRLLRKLNDKNIQSTRDLHEGLKMLELNINKSKLDYILQCFHIRSRSFETNLYFYDLSVRKIKFKQFIKNITKAIRSFFK